MEYHVTTVKGKKVRIDELTFDNEVDFDRLNSSGQERLFLEDKNLFFFDALMSKESSIQELAKKHMAKCSSKILNETLKNLILGYPEKYEPKLVLEILSVPHLQLDSDIIGFLSESKYPEITKRVKELAVPA